MGERFTLAESCYAPLIKLLDLIKWLDIWLENRPNVTRWWQALGNRPSVLGLDEYEGHTADPASDHAKAGLALFDEAKDRLAAYQRSRA